MKNVQEQSLFHQDIHPTILYFATEHPSWEIILKYLKKKHNSIQGVFVLYYNSLTIPPLIPLMILFLATEHDSMKR